MTIILRGLLSNLKMHRGLKYIILNTLGVDPPTPPPNSHKKRYFYMWIENVKIQHIFIILGVHQYM
jgi:hypothetical protein